ncbi:MAG: hypothetical protein QM784_10030 [Polyangiaceae bacterium]
MHLRRRVMGTSRRMRNGLFVCGCLLCLGCGGKAEQTKPVPASELPGYAAKRLCDAYADCCNAVDAPFAVESCVDRAQSAYASRDVCPPNRQYDPIQAAECFEALPQNYVCATQSGQVSLVHGYTLPRACQLMCQGTLPLGATCNTQMDCAPIEGARISCGITDLNSSPKCLRQIRGKVGDRCFDTCIESERDDGWGCLGRLPDQVDSSSGGPAACYIRDGLFCGTDRTCHELVPIGKPCENRDVCVMGAMCQTGTCKPPVEIGGPCASLFECGPVAYCSSAGICVNMKPDGDACESVEQCEHICDVATHHCVSGAEQYVSDMTAACANPWRVGIGLFFPR